MEYQEGKQVTELEGAGDLEEDEESRFHFEETIKACAGEEDREEAGKVNNNLPCTSTTTLKAVPS